MSIVIQNFLKIKKLKICPLKWNKENLKTKEKIDSTLYAWITLWISIESNWQLVGLVSYKLAHFFFNCLIITEKRVLRSPGTVSYVWVFFVVFFISFCFVFSFQFNQVLLHESYKPAVRCTLIQGCHFFCWNDSDLWNSFI